MPGAGGVFCNSMEYFTSSAVTSLPSWNLTPFFKCQIQVLSSGVSQDSASAGLTSKSLSHSTSESYSISVPYTWPCEMLPSGIRFPKATSTPQVSVPPDLGDLAAGVAATAGVAAAAAGVLAAG